MICLWSLISLIQEVIGRNKIRKINMFWNQKTSMIHIILSIKKKITGQYHRMIPFICKFRFLLVPMSRYWKIIPNQAWQGNVKGEDLDCWIKSNVLLKIVLKRKCLDFSCLNLLLGNLLFLKKILKFYLFIFGCVRSLLLRAGFLPLRPAGATLCCGARASHCGGFSCCGARALGVWASVVVTHQLSSCGSWA